MKKILTALISAALLVAVCWGWHVLSHPMETENVRVGFIYVGDQSTAYTYNFIKAQTAIEEAWGERVITLPVYNVAEGEEEGAIQSLIEADCQMIFGTSFGYGDSMKAAAALHPEIQFCQATSVNANEDPVLENYHTFMGRIYEGRYISGVVAGMKLNELIDNGVIAPQEALIGYAAAFPYAEVISGYTAFLLGARSVCPTAEMEVIYTNTWSDYALEKACAERLIVRGCRVISQHSDTSGPAVACENARSLGAKVYHVGYNQSMTAVAPTSSIASCRINWAPYMSTAVGALLADKKIEQGMERKVVVHGQDVGAGFDAGWVQMLSLNDVAAPIGAQTAVAECIRQFKAGKLVVFQGEYTGRDPFDPTDIIDLRNGYQENEHSSAPSFHYVLDDIIHVIE